MTTSSRIIVGVDGSPASVDTLRWAARQAQLTGGTLEAIISWEYPPQYGSEYVYMEDVNWADLARTTLEAAVTDAAIGDPSTCTLTVTEGHPAQVLEMASSEADLLVIGSRGRGGFTGLLLGSVSEHVIAHADCPVVVIRHPRATSSPAHESEQGGPAADAAPAPQTSGSPGEGS